MPRVLRYIVLDELHTYRGRQGADVAILVRRLRDRTRDGRAPLCIGTSATMANEGEASAIQATVAEVASRIFGTPINADAVIGETLTRATDDRLRLENIRPLLPEAIRGGSGTKAFLAFRLHRFISGSAEVFTTLRPVPRNTTLEGQRFDPLAPTDRLYPTRFCRACGQEFHPITRTEVAGQPTFLPRPIDEEPRDDANSADEAGYLAPQMRPGDADYQYDGAPDTLPEDWLEDSPLRQGPPQQPSCHSPACHPCRRRRNRGRDRPRLPVPEGQVRLLPRMPRPALAQCARTHQAGGPFR